MDNLQDVSKQLQNNSVKAVTDSVGAFFEELVQVPVNSTIPEQVFVEYFLDFFKSGMTTDANNILGIKWAELARSPFNPVDVIDMVGNYLYTVPPMIMKPNLTGMPIGDVNFGKIASTYELKNNRLPAEASNYLNNQLNGLAEQIQGPDINMITKQWEYIFARYVKPAVLQPQVPSLPTAVSEDTSMEGVIDYD